MDKKEEKSEAILNRRKALKRMALLGGAVVSGIGITALGCKGPFEPGGTTENDTSDKDPGTYSNYSDYSNYYGNHYNNFYSNYYNFYENYVDYYN